MGKILNQLDANLARLAWSLWTELGVAGLERKHQNFPVAPEELIILTALISEFDPRLRDEALDWCIRYHHLISSIRLQILVEKYKEFIQQPFSLFAATINSNANIRTKWPVLTKTSPLKFRPSGKSILRDFHKPSMIHLRLRSFLGVGIRADVLAFLLNEPGGEFSASDFLETGYSKRRLAQILSDLAAAEILSQRHIRNQLRYTLVKRDLLIKILGGIPKNCIHWDRILATLLPLRACLQNVEDASIGVRVVDMRNLLSELSQELMQIKLKAPPLQNDFEAYWRSITEWILDFSESLSQGMFKA